MDFVALDFETANASMASICQVGIAGYRNGACLTDFSTLINPEDYFSEFNIAIHGIDADAVVGAPTFPDIYPRLLDLLSERIVVSHTPFDRVALQQTIARYGLPAFQCRWLDSARVVRRTWADCARSGYGLAPTAARLGITFNHHDAMADARTAGAILIHAIAHTGIGLDEWLIRSKTPISVTRPIAQDGSPSGALYGECIVFTGALQIQRSEAATLAAQAGCTVVDHVSKKISILVVGDQDIRRIGPSETKSRKHRLAEELIAKGAAIRIIGEADFRALCQQEGR